MAATNEERTPLISDSGVQEVPEELSGVSSTAIRNGFVQKVYGILGAQLVVTALVGGLVMNYANTLKASSPATLVTLLVLSSVASLSMMFVFMCCPDTMRHTPTNYILLSVFTLAESVMVGFISASYTQESVLIVLAITCFVVLGLTLFACQTTYDFSGFLPYAVAACMVLCGFGFIMMFASMLGASGPAFQTMRLVYAFFGALLFSFFIVLDTQMIVGGKHHKYQFSVDDYCMAAINLYLDIVQLFLYLLQLFGDRR
eukprot:TRINITY_DN7287_c0_g1_i2.p1 TRINITY_DN7287_c0_g1~~TRINITY_DN7287_c0_g1_i2.p1  ORF type:complete len:258 (+),score=53.39 TRINITY_DN7287_c0_g1_i2:82-855(+)